MHSRRLASLLIGAWLAASIFMDCVAIQNFRMVDHFLNAPGPLAAGQIRVMGGTPAARLFLRHEAAETNRFFFEQWEYAQLAIGVAVVMVFVFGHGEVPRFALALAALMLCIVALDRFYLTGEITRLGRLLDYPDLPGASATRFWTLHGVYSGLELLKIGLGCAVAGALIIRRADRDKFAREHRKIAKERSGLTAPSSR